MKKIVLLILALFCLKGVPALADEGMWVPALIQSRIKDMKAKGFKLTAEDIYSINRSSLKDAVLLFGSGCTGEVISDEGLFLTNHHCGYYFIGSHSSVEHDYLTNGFWAMNRSEELPNPGLTVSFLIRMEDVTDRALKGVGDEMPQAERDSMVKANAAGVIAKATAGTHYEAAVEPFYYGNQYFLFVYEKFRDVRLVAAPPSAIGKFGGDTDNWMWPRHTGDFSMFRIYADKNNNPADYSKDNVPYRPRRSFTISTAGLKEGDFTMVYGNPGRTMQYVVSDAIDYAVNRGNPAKIKMRTMRLEIMNAEQAKDPATRIAYAAKNARVSNQWKKWQGESKGLARLGTLDKKRAFEAQFTAWAADKPLYRDVLPKLRALYAELAPYAFARDYYQEAYQAIEMTQFAQNAAKGIFKPDAEKAGDGFFKNYSQTIDRLSTQAVLGEYVKNVPAEWTPAYFLEAVQKAGGVDRYVDELFEQSNFSTIEKYKARFGRFGYKGRCTGKRSGPVAGRGFQHVLQYESGRDIQAPQHRNQHTLPPLHERVDGDAARPHLLSRRQPDAACRLRDCRGLQSGRRRLLRTVLDDRRHYGEGQSGYLRLQHSAAIARPVQDERVWTLERRRFGPGLFPGHEPHHGRQFRQSCAERPRTTGRHQLRPDVGKHDERLRIRCRQVPQHHRRHPLRALRDRPHR